VKISYLLKSSKSEYSTGTKRERRGGAKTPPTDEGTDNGLNHSSVPISISSILVLAMW